MKKKLSGLLLVASTVLGMGALTACSKGGTSSSTPAGGDSSVTTPSETPSSAATKTRVQLAIEEAEKLTHDQLFAKAAEELGTSGKLKILATTSRGGKPAVTNLFLSELQKHNSAITDPLEYKTTVDGTIYTELAAEVSAGKKDGYSGTITQDGYQLQKKGIDTGMFENYVPKTWLDATESDKAAKNPFTLQYNFKTIMYNNANGNMNIDNIWDITDSSFKNKIDTMDPNNENVNMDWLIQLTSDDNCDLLKSAYDDSTRNSDVNIEKYASKGAKLKYAYAFIDRFLENAVFYEDDGKAMTHLAAAPGNVGWIVYSKILKVSESAAISKKDIVVAALGKDNTDGSALTTSSIKGFGGFMYKHYLQVMKDAQYPYATCAFFELISTNATAYKVWGDDVGDYPTLPTINVDRTKGGKDVTTEKYGVTNIACLNDPNSNWWINTAKSVVETPSYIGANYQTHIGFIDDCIAAKAL